MRLQLWSIITASVLLASPAFAEFQQPGIDDLNNKLNEIQNQGPTTNSGSGLTAAEQAALAQSGLGLAGTEMGKNYYGQTSNGIASGGLNNALQDYKGILYDTSNNSKGREGKAESGKNSAGQGAAAHAVTGALLTATGVAMIASPDIPTKVAGAELLAKAAMEFAQSGADSGAQGANGAQESLLKSDVNLDVPKFLDDASKNAQAKNTNDILNKINNSAAQDALTGQGVNADDFLNKLASGAFSNQQEILNNLGIKDSLSDEDMAKAAALANVNSLDAVKALTFDESKNDLNGNGISTNGPGGAGVGATNANSAAGKEAPGASEGIAADLARSLAKGEGLEGALAGHEGAPLGSPDWAKNMLNGLGGGANAEKAIVAAMNAQQLEAIGLAKLVKGQNLFQRVHRTYRRFGDWRKGKTRLAANP